MRSRTASIRICTESSSGDSRVTSGCWSAAIQRQSWHSPQGARRPLAAIDELRDPACELQSARARILVNQQCHAPGGPPRTRPSTSAQAAANHVGQDWPAHRGASRRFEAERTSRSPQARPRRPCRAPRWRRSRGIAPARRARAPGSDCARGRRTAPTRLRSDRRRRVAPACVRGRRAPARRAAACNRATDRRARPARGAR